MSPAMGPDWKDTKAARRIESVPRGGGAHSMKRAACAAACAPEHFTGWPEGGREERKGNMAETISVIVAIYDVERYLRRCIDSILAQTYRELEIILVDDGSTDGCGAICDEYAVRDRRVKVIHKENGGLADARNAGIAAATGVFYTFVDGDDYMSPLMIQRLYNAQKQSDADITICRYNCVDEEGHEEALRHSMPHAFRRARTGREVLSGTALEKTWVYWLVAWNKLYRASLFDKLRYPAGKLHEDVFIMHRLYYAANRVDSCDDALYYYVQRPDSITNRRYTAQRLDEAEAFLDWIDLALDKGLGAHAVRAFFYQFEHIIRLSYDRAEHGDARVQARRVKLYGEFKKRYPVLMRFGGGPAFKLRVMRMRLRAWLAERQAA